MPCANYFSLSGETGSMTYMSQNWKDWVGYSAKELYQEPEVWSRFIHLSNSGKTVNAYIESFNSRHRDELLNRELFLSIDELKYLPDHWQMDYNRYGQHCSLDYTAPAVFIVRCLEQGPSSLHLIPEKENCCEEL